MIVVHYALDCSGTCSCMYLVVGMSPPDDVSLPPTLSLSHTHTPYTTHHTLHPHTIHHTLHPHTIHYTPYTTHHTPYTTPTHHTLHPPSLPSSAAIMIWVVTRRTVQQLLPLPVPQVIVLFSCEGGRLALCAAVILQPVCSLLRIIKMLLIASSSGLHTRDP